MKMDEEVEEYVDEKEEKREDGDNGDERSGGCYGDPEGKSVRFVCIATSSRELRSHPPCCTFSHSHSAGRNAWAALTVNT